MMNESSSYSSGDLPYEPAIDAVIPSFRNLQGVESMREAVAADENFANLSRIIRATGLPWGDAHIFQSVLDASPSLDAAVETARAQGLSHINVQALHDLAYSNVYNDRVIEHLAKQGIEIPGQSTLREALSGLGTSIARQNSTQSFKPAATRRAEKELAARRAKRKPPQKARRTPEAFFSRFETPISSLSELLHVLAEMQTIHTKLGLVWRGQQCAEWGVFSSLTRRLFKLKKAANEEQMIAVEHEHFATAGRWGSHYINDLNFLAELQHEGVPTRLLDVTLEPEVAVWFAVQQHGEHDQVDARLFAWGRGSDPTIRVTARGGEPFWQGWDNESDRRDSKWGTSEALFSWQPSALNERMRAQRAAFLFDAAPIIDKHVLERINDKLDEPWTTNDFSSVTRVLGVPTRHDEDIDNDAEDLLPMFTLRIAAKAKPEIRTYLRTKGLDEATIYPDRAGLLDFLRRS